MWSDSNVSKEQAYEEGAKFKQSYFNDAQDIFSRVQHHFHEKTMKGYKPLQACMSSRSKHRCKHDFPMEERLTKQVRIVRRGNARRFGVRIKGKRNSLGKKLWADARVCGRAALRWLWRCSRAAIPTQLRISACHPCHVFMTMSAPNPFSASLATTRSFAS